MKPIMFLIEDDPMNLRAMTTLLEDDFTVYSFPSGEKCLSGIGKIIPAIVVSDFKMTIEMNGLQLLAKIKVAFPKTKRVILTGNTWDIQCMDDIKKSDIDGYRTKPIDPQEFIDLCKKLASQ